LLQNGYAPLHLAASGGHADIATLLLNNGANANCRSKNGLAPMHLCAQEDKVNVAEILEQHGAEIDPQTKVHMFYFLHFYIPCGHLPIK
jgi:ankyrin